MIGNYLASQNRLLAWISDAFKAGCGRVIFAPANVVRAFLAQWCIFESYTHSATA